MARSGFSCSMQLSTGAEFVLVSLPFLLIGLRMVYEIVLILRHTVTVTMPVLYVEGQKNNCDLFQGIEQRGSTSCGIIVHKCCPVPLLVGLDFDWLDSRI